MIKETAKDIHATHRCCHHPFIEGEKAPSCNVLVHVRKSEFPGMFFQLGESAVTIQVSPTEKKLLKKYKECQTLLDCLESEVPHLCFSTHK